MRAQYAKRSAACLRQRQRSVERLSILSRSRQPDRRILVSHPDILLGESDAELRTGSGPADDGDGGSTPPGAKHHTAHVKDLGLRPQDRRCRPPSPFAAP